MTNSIPQCPSNYILVEIGKKFNDIVTTASGMQLYQDTTFRPEEYATVLGKVASIPRSVNGGDWPRRSLIEPIVEVGDEIAFNYLTVFDLNHKDDREDVYYEDPTKNPFLQQWSNKKGEKIWVVYKPYDDMFDVAAFTADGIMYDKKLRISQEAKDNWLGLFPFSETHSVSYNNLIEWNGKEYWKVDYANVFAVRKGNNLIPVGSHVILDLPVPEVRKKVGKIELMNEVRKVMSKYQAESQVIAIADPLKGKTKPDVKPGEYVVYDDRYGSVYEIWGRPVVILRQEHLLAKLN